MFETGNHELHYLFILLFDSRLEKSPLLQLIQCNFKFIFIDVINAIQ